MSLHARAWQHIVLLTGIIFFDRITKALALTLDQEYVINFLVSFDLSFNRGITWGILSSWQGAGNFIVLGTLFIMCLLAFYSWHQYVAKRVIYGPIMILAGGCSNLYDRFYWPGVIDFIQVHYQEWHFPAFNVADSSIVIGVLLMLYSFVAHE